MREEIQSLQESGVVNTANKISMDLTKFLNDIVTPKSAGYVKNEKDAAALLFDILKHRYKF